MNVSLRHLPAIKRQQVQAIIKIVRQAVNPEKIILFGTYSDPGVTAGILAGSDSGAGAIPFAGNDARSAGGLHPGGGAGAGAGFFAGKRFPAELLTFDLLVVTRQGDHRSDYELQDIIENRCRGCAPVTVLVHDIQYMNSRLAEGNYFFTMIRREAILLYDAGHIPLAQAIRPDLELIRKIAEKDFERWKLQARAFFRSALFNCEHKEWKLAAFLLHQSAEHIYQAILLAFTGYKPTTHNLDKLRRYTNRFSIELALLFPRDSEEEDRLFRLLLQGYVDARYKEDYSISEEEAGLLTERIDRLLSIAERVCRNRFINLEKMAAGM